MYSEKNYILIVSLILLLTLLLLVFLFLYYFYKQSKQNQIQVLKTQIASKESEAAKISANLHDDLGPLLASIKIYSNAIHTTDIHNLQYINQININLDDCINSLKKISSELRPPNFEVLGLEKAIELFVNKINMQSDLKIHFDVANDWIKMSEEEEMHIYRIILEIITNTLKHAKAKDLEINLFSSTNSLIIETKDNGIGMDLYNMKEGNGLINIKQRVKVMHGKIDINSKSKNGTYIQITLPKTI